MLSTVGAIFDPYTAHERKRLTEYYSSPLTTRGTLAKELNVEPLKKIISENYPEGRWGEKYVVAKVIIKALERICSYAPVEYGGVYRIHLSNRQPKTYTNAKKETKPLVTLALPERYEIEAEYLRTMNYTVLIEMLTLIKNNEDRLGLEFWTQYEDKGSLDKSFVFRWGSKHNENMFIAHIA